MGGRNAAALLATFLLVSALSLWARFADNEMDLRHPELRPYKVKRAAAIEVAGLRPRVVHKNGSENGAGSVRRTMELRHIFHPSSPFKHDLHNASVQETKLTVVKRSMKYVQESVARRRWGLRAGLNGGEAGAELYYGPNSNAQTHVSGLDGRFFYAQIGVGSPSQLNTFLIDTGSDLTWLQCLPCVKCYQQGPGPDEQPIPVFDPQKSTSLVAVPCPSDQCISTGFRGRTKCNDAKFCQYDLRYNDGSQTSGLVVVDNLSFGELGVLTGMVLGCSENTEGLYDTTFGTGSGLLGLGPGPYSLFAQLNQPIFFCLPHMFADETQTGFVGIGVVSDPGKGNTVHTRLVDGVIIDTGALISLLEGDAYTQFRKAILNAAKDAGFPPPFQFEDTPFDTCFRNPDLQHAPSVSLHFDADSATLPLPYENLFLDFGDGNICLAFLPSSKYSLPFNVLGAIQLTGFLVTIDTAGAAVSFSPNICR